MTWSYDLPSVPGVLTREQCRQTALSIAAAQESSGAGPWFTGGHTGPGGRRVGEMARARAARALTTAALLGPARAAFEWCRQMQRPDGSWPMQLRAGTIEDANSDSNFCAYIAAGVWHHALVTGDHAFAAAMWPVVSAAIEFVLDLQTGYGEISWARSESGPEPEAVLTGWGRVYPRLR